MEGTALNRNSPEADIDQPSFGGRLFAFSAVGMAFFWLFLRFTIIEGLAATVIAPDYVSNNWFLAYVSLTSLLGLAAITAQRQVAGLLRKRWPVLGVSVLATLFSAALVVSGTSLGVLAGHGRPVIAVFAAAALAASMLALLFGWIALFASFAEKNAKWSMLCLIFSFILSFAIALTDHALSSPPYLIPLLMPTISAAAWVLCKYDAPAYEKPRVGIFDGLPIGLLAVLIVFLLGGISIRGVIGDLSLNVTPESNLYLKHLLTILEAFVVMLLVLFARSYKRLMYEVWIFLAGLLTIGLLLVGTRNPSWLAMGIGTVTAGRSCFELLLFAVLALSPGFDRRSLIAPAVLLFVVPETLGGLAGHWLIPSLMSHYGESPSEFAGVLSIVIGAALVVCTIIVLGVVSFRGIYDDALGAVPSLASPTPHQPVMPTGDVLSVRLIRLGRECGLTTREIEIAQYIARGYSAQRTAEAESVSINTVQSHMRNVYRKLDIHSRQELIDRVERVDR